jgi:hypothetical protein
LRTSPSRLAAFFPVTKLPAREADGRQGRTRRDDHWPLTPQIQRSTQASITPELSNAPWPLVQGVTSVCV